MTLSAMYQDRLLDEYRAPQGRRELVDATGSAERKNPVCGDVVHVMVRLAEGRVADVAFEGQGCSITVASASLMTQVVSGLELSKARSLITLLEAMLVGSLVASLPVLLEPLRGTVSFPARHGCVMLPWLALRDALG